MDLKSGYPFWTVRNGLLATFPPLTESIECDIAIVGAGITGSLIAHALAAAGRHVVVVDQRDVGWGSTAASTALLQYENDEELQALARRFGEARAVLAYRACEQAIGELAALAGKVGDVGFRRMSSLYVASHWHHSRRLRAEAALRERSGFDVEMLDRASLQRRFGVHASSALLTRPAAQVDPYRLTYALLEKLRAEGVAVFDRSAMLGWKATRSGIIVNMQRNARLRARYLVIAAGYESERFLKARVANNHSSYALVTEPLQGGLGVFADTLLWETARPYLYVRSTEDGRLLIGGEDDRIDIPLRRDARVASKSTRLLRKFKAFVPALDLEKGFAWAGTFAETADGLPFFGAHPSLDPHVLFAMAYGGNGITYSAIGAQIIRAIVQGSEHPLQHFFSFARLRE
jgi:glycine/D-amino acid oxidase-like deaminating enzyme